MKEDNMKAHELAERALLSLIEACRYMNELRDSVSDTRYGDLWTDTMMKYHYRYVYLVVRIE